MIKLSSINGVAKKAALGAMLASSVAMFASNPIKTARTDNPPQTEVVSKDGAAALKAMALPQQQNPTVPTVHNKALDEKFLKLAHNEEEKKFMEDFLSNIYKSNGNYLASATIQQNIDLNMFVNFLDGNIEILKIFDEEAYNKIDRVAMQKVKEKSEPIKQWLKENYFKVYNQPFGQFDHPPDAEEVNHKLDFYVELDPNNYFVDGWPIYRGERNRNNYYFKNSSLDEVQKNSNLISIKTHVANEILFRNLMKAEGFYKDYEKSEILDNFKFYINAVKPVWGN